MQTNRTKGNWISAKAFRVGVGIVSVVLTGYFVFAVTIIVRHGTSARWFGWKSEKRDGICVVTAVNDAGPASGIVAVGDRLLSIDGDERVQEICAGQFLWLQQAWKQRMTPYTLLIDRQGIELEIETTPEIVRLERQWVWRAPILLSAFVFWVVSALVGLLRPADRLPRLITINGFANTLVLLKITIWPSWWFMTAWEYSALFVLTCVTPLQFLLGYWIGLAMTGPGALKGTMSTTEASQSESTLAMPASHNQTLDLPPEEHPLPRENPRKLWWWVGIILSIWSVIYYGIQTVTRVIAIPDFPGTIDFLARNLWFFEPWYRHRGLHYVAYISITSATIAAMVFANYRRITDQDQKRRLKWVVYGSAAGILPWAVIISVTRVLGKDFRYDPFWSLPAMLSIGASILIPLSLGHAVIKHRILGVDVVVRRGIKYLLAKNMLRIVLLAPIIALVYSVLANRDLTVAEIFTSGSRPLIVGMAISAGLGLRYRQRLTDELDRRFFRTRYDQERILGELINTLKEENSLDTIATLIESRIGSALHPETIVVVYRHPDNPEFVSSTQGPAVSTSVPDDSELARLAEQSDGPIDLGPDNRHRRTMLPPHELDRLDALGVELVVPMQGPSVRLAGLILLGAKKSEEAYSANDKTLLSAIADQTAVVWENRWLTDRVNREGKVRREVLAHIGSDRVNLLKECLVCGACYDQSEERCSEDGTELELTMPVERIIDDRYRLDRLLGRGGMGAVFQSMDLRLDRQVAVKIMMGHLFGDRTAQRRFEREAQTSAGLRHPRIIQIYDFGSIGDSGGFLVMELLEGETLRSRLKRDGRIEPIEAAEIIGGVLDGLIAAHGAGVVHRDLKPDNVMLTYPSASAESESAAQDVKILDFGLAKLVAADQEGSGALTATGAILGTWTYMSPEQLLGQTVDERSDLFSLGVMAVEAITGQRPFSGKNPSELLHSLENDTVSLDGADTGVASLETVLRTATASNPSDRYRSAAEMRDTLIPALRSCPVLD